MKIILGSQSEGRQKVLREAGIEFTVMPADIDEKLIRHDDSRQLPLLLARAKADVLIKLIEEPVLLITGDTVAVFRGELREKPKTAVQAREYLESYHPNEPVWINTGVVVTNTRTGERVEGFGSAAAYFRPIPSEVIEELIAADKPFKWAGGFAIDEPLLMLYVEKIDGEKESIYGLPLKLTLRLLKEARAT